jgi:hypothetical protein
MAHWINHRWTIYVKKSRGEHAPWTNDRILQNFRFCNVHRENDRVTQFVRDEWRNDNGGEHNLVPALVLARMFNLPSTLRALGFPYEWDTDRMIDIVKDMRADKQKIFNGAYLITTCGVKMDKVDYVFRVANDVRGLGFQTLHRPTTLEETHRLFTTIKGLGDFLAGQVIADLKNTPGYPLETAPDRFTWATPGPGSMRGLARLEGSHRPSKGHFLARMQAARTPVDRLLLKMPIIDAQDFQNCLCEFDKWDRTYLGQSRPKQRYDGRHPDS